MDSDLRKMSLKSSVTLAVVITMALFSSLAFQWLLLPVNGLVIGLAIAIVWLFTWIGVTLWFFLKGAWLGAGGFLFANPVVFVLSLIVAQVLFPPSDGAQIYVLPNESMSYASQSVTSVLGANPVLDMVISFTISAGFVYVGFLAWHKANKFLTRRPGTVQS